MKINSSSLRKKVAREAANLIYFGIEKEYKQAKLKAAKIFRVKFLPTNLEVAIELNKIAEENEGLARKERLTQMRIEALKLMKILEAHNPILIGSVWRGTAYRGSDIDISVYADEPSEIQRMLNQNNFKILQTEWVTVTKKGLKKISFHIYSESPTKEKFEIIIRSPEGFSRKEKCEVYGDRIVGLNVKELERVLKENPTQCFLPLNI